MESCMQVEGLTKSFGDRLLFSDVTFGLVQGERVGLIAANGSGKTTLLNIIAGNENPDEGSVVFHHDIRIGYLQQDPHYPADYTVRKACLDKCDDDDHRLGMEQILTKLKICDYEQLISQLSGGQLKRVALAAVLVHKPDLLMLDEPTNHLDLDMVEWLEEYLERVNMSLLMVTHDRYFLDRVCNSIIEIDNRQIYTYKGNYSYYLERRQERMDAANIEMSRATNLYRTELEWMRRMPQARGHKARYREDNFRDLEKKVKSGYNDGQIQLNVKATYIGSKIFEAEHLCKCFGDLKIFNDFNYIFDRYEKMGVVGNNGTGKSTFVKILLGKEPFDSGKLDIGETVRFGYYSQEGLKFNEQQKVIDVITDIAEVIETGDGRRLTAGQFLQYFLFSPESQYNYVQKLSGGERRRLYLCTVLMSNPNFLILDEPTNDLDILTMNILEEYLRAFKGCLIVVSHDRYFMDKVVDHLLVFHGNAEIQDFPGNYTQFRAWSEENKCDKKEAVEKPKEKAQRFRLNDKRKKTFKERQVFAQLEKDIEALEKEKKELEMALGSGSLDAAAITEKSKRYSEISEILDEKSMYWLELSEIGD